MIEHVKFKKPVPFLYIKEGDVFRVYYDKNCRRLIKVDEFLIDVDKRKDLDYMELLVKGDKVEANNASTY
jgi:hypothetical protein